MAIRLFITLSWASGSTRSRSRQESPTRPTTVSSSPTSSTSRAPVTGRRTIISSEPPSFGDARMWSRHASRSGANRFATNAPHGDDAGPVGQVEVFLVVGGTALAHLRRRLVEREAEHERLAQLVLVRRPRLGRPAGVDVLDEQLERSPLLVGVGHLLRGAEH